MPKTTTPERTGIIIRPETEDIDAVLAKILSRPGTTRILNDLAIKYINESNTNRHGSTLLITDIHIARQIIGQALRNALENNRPLGNDRQISSSIKEELNLRRAKYREAHALIERMGRYTNKSEPLSVNLGIPNDLLTKAKNDLHDYSRSITTESLDSLMTLYVQRSGALSKIAKSISELGRLDHKETGTDKDAILNSAILRSFVIATLLRRLGYDGTIDFPILSPSALQYFSSKSAEISQLNIPDFSKQLIARLALDNTDSEIVDAFVSIANSTIKTALLWNKKQGTMSLNKEWREFYKNFRSFLVIPESFTISREHIQRSIRDGSPHLWEDGIYYEGKIIPAPKNLIGALRYVEQTVGISKAPLKSFEGALAAWRSFEKKLKNTERIEKLKEEINRFRKQLEDTTHEDISIEATRRARNEANALASRISYLEQLVKYDAITIQTYEGIKKRIVSLIELRELISKYGNLAASRLELHLSNQRAKIEEAETNVYDLCQELKEAGVVQVLLVRRRNMAIPSQPEEIDQLITRIKSLKESLSRGTRGFSNVDKIKILEAWREQDKKLPLFYVYERSVLNGEVEEKTSQALVNALIEELDQFENNASSLKEYYLQIESTEEQSSFIREILGMLDKGASATEIQFLILQRIRTSQIAILPEKTDYKSFYGKKLEDLTDFLNEHLKRTQRSQFIIPERNQIETIIGQRITSEALNPFRAHELREFLLGIYEFCDGKLVPKNIAGLTVGKLAVNLDIKIRAINAFDNKPKRAAEIVKLRQQYIQLRRDVREETTREEIIKRRNQILHLQRELEEAPEKLVESLAEYNFVINVSELGHLKQSPRNLDEVSKEFREFSKQEQTRRINIIPD